MRGIQSIIVFFIFFLLSFTINLSQGSITNSKGPYNFSYLTHAPIEIRNNSGYNHTNGVTKGNGTQMNPYTIEEWQINASNFVGIDIRNTDVFFVIQNCRIFDGRNNSIPGIYLVNVTNGVISNNTIINCKANAIESSSNIIVDGNNIQLCSDTAISPFSSKNITISNNVMVNNTHGPVLISSHDILVRNNSLINLHRGIIVFNCVTNISINDNRLSNISNEGIIVDTSSNCQIFNNSISNANRTGIDIISSNNTSIWNNTISKGNKYGISAYLSHNNSIFHNKINDSNSYGFFLLDCKHNIIYNNVILNNNGTLLIKKLMVSQGYDNTGLNFWNTSTEGNYWSDWTSPDNDTNGIVDIPYYLDGSSGARDYYPLTKMVFVKEYSSISPASLVALLTIFAVPIVGSRRKSNR